MMNESEKFFFLCINDFLSGRSTKLPENANAEEIFKLFEKHGMQGVLFHQIKSEINGHDFPEEIRTRLFREYAHECFLYKKRCILLKQIHDEFQKNSIPYLIFKGTEIAALYPVPALRTMGDSDILIHTEDKKKADAALMSLDFRNTTRRKDEWKYEHTGMHFELHDRMMSDDVRNDKAQKAFFGKNWDYAVSEENSVQYHFDWSYHFVYILTHLRKHFISTGVGLRPFIDLSLIVSKCSLDWEWIRSELDKMNMTKFASVCLTLCGRWFDTRSPLLQESIDEAFIADAADTIIHNGLYGWGNPDKRYNYYVFSMRKTKSGFSAAVAKKMIPDIFPSYNRLKNTRHYTFIDGKPFLLPFAWIMRWFDGIFNGKVKSFFRRTSSAMNTSEESISSRNDLLDKWGL